MADEYLKLVSPTGVAVDFIEIATIYLGTSKYIIVQPAKLFDGMEEDEAFVYKVTKNKNRQNKYELVLDDEIIDKVFIEYNKLLDEEEGED